jgi:hypothetical protein
MLFEDGIVNQCPPGEAAVAAKDNVVPVIWEVPHYILKSLQSVSQCNWVAFGLLLDLRLGAVELL